MESNPSLIQIKSEIQHYDSIEQDIDDIKPIIILGSTELSTGKEIVMCSRQQLDEKLQFLFSPILILFFFILAYTLFYIVCYWVKFH